MRDRAESASVLCVLLLCFDGAKRAAQIRRPLSKQLEQHGGAILDAAIIRVDGEGKARVYDPQRTVAGLLTAALTWGVFGGLTGGLSGLIVWAVIGGVGGGLFAYYREQPLSGTQLRRIGEGMRPDSSAIVVFLKCGADEAVLLDRRGGVRADDSKSGGDLGGADGPGAGRRRWPHRGVRRGAGRAAAGGRHEHPQDHHTDTSTDKHHLLNMLLVRLPGQHTVRQALAELAPAKTPDPGLPQVMQVEVVLESDAGGGLHVHSPNLGVRFSARSSLVSWGVLGLISGAIGGWAGGGGILGFLGGGLITGVVWGAFGILAGALYGLFVGNVLSARQLKKMDVLVPPNSSLAFVWADGDLTNEAIDRWAPPGSQRLVVRFDTTSRGIVLGV